MNFSIFADNQGNLMGFALNIILMYMPLFSLVAGLMIAFLFLRHVMKLSNMRGHHTGTNARKEGMRTIKRRD